MFLTKSICCIFTISFLYQSIKVTSILLRNFFVKKFFFCVKFGHFLHVFIKKFLFYSILKFFYIKQLLIKIKTLETFFFLPNFAKINTIFFFSFLWISRQLVIRFEWSFFDFVELIKGYKIKKYLSKLDF